MTRTNGIILILQVPELVLICTDHLPLLLELCLQVLLHVAQRVIARLHPHVRLDQLVSHQLEVFVDGSLVYFRFCFVVVGEGV